MKRSESLLIGLLAISGASADSLGVRAAHAPQAASIANPQSWQRGRRVAGVRMTDLKDDVAQEVRATTTFVKEQASNARERSHWLTALAGCGLVMLQLRRKHKSLPQRRIAPYG